MTDSTKALVGTIAGLTALVATFAIMADCSVKVARIDAQAADCAKAGGKFLRGVAEGDSLCVPSGEKK